MLRPCPTESQLQIALAEALRPVCRFSGAAELFGLLRELFQIVLTEEYLLVSHNENTWWHEATVLSTAMKMSRGENLSWPTTRILAITSVVHDNRVLRRITEEHLRNAQPAEQPGLERERKNTTRIHQDEGAQQAREIIDRANQQVTIGRIDEEEADEVCRIIQIHDAPKLSEGIPTRDLCAIFRECDRMWMQTRRGLACDIARHKHREPEEVRPTPSQLAKQSRANWESYEEEWQRCYSKSEPGKWHVKDFHEKTLFRTSTGWRIAQELRDQWRLISQG